MSHGPLHGLRVIEMAGIGPCPFAGLLLADMGAEVIVVERPVEQRSLGGGGQMNRGKRSVLLDLKQAAAQEALRRLVLSADALIEGYRPGVMERLGLGPAVFESTHPRLVYGRVTGWGQTGPLATTAGHDLNYLALSGLLSLSARPGQAPTVPPTVIGDMAGGGLLLAFGLVCALLESRQSGRGQVVDAAMLDGAVLFSSLVHSLRAQQQWPEQGRDNLFLHQSPFYDSFECADGRYLCLAAIEPRFHRRLLELLGLEDLLPQAQMDSRLWPTQRARVAARLRERSRDDWCRLLEGDEACVAPVLSLDEAAEHPQLRARQCFEEDELGRRQPAAAPRLSRTPGKASPRSPAAGEHSRELLSSLGLSDAELRALLP